MVAGTRAACLSLTRWPPRAAAQGIGAPPATGPRPFPPDSSVFGEAERGELLAYVLQVLEQGADTSVATAAGAGLPAAVLPTPWLDLGRETEAHFTAALPGGLPIYVVVTVLPELLGGRWRQSAQLSLDGVSVDGLERYARSVALGGTAADAPHDSTAHDLVLTPPPPGRHQIDLRVEIEGRTAGATYPRTVGRFSYDVRVQPAEEAGPLVVVDSSTGERYVVVGHERRLVQDEVFFGALGLEALPARPATAADLDAIPLGPPLPAWPDGAVVRAEGLAPLYELRDGQRRWIRSLEAFAATGVGWEAVQTWPRALVHSVGPAPEDGLVVRGTQPTVYLVERGTLRPFPSLSVFLAAGRSWDDVVPVTERWVQSLPAGRPVG